MRTRFFALLLMLVLVMGCTTVENHLTDPNVPVVPVPPPPAPAVDLSGGWFGLMSAGDATFATQSATVTLTQGGAVVTGSYTTLPGSFTGQLQGAYVQATGRFAGQMTFVDATGTCSSTFDGTASATKIEVNAGVMIGGCVLTPAGLRLSVSR